MHAVEMSYMRGACGVSRWDGLSNESVYERCGMRRRGIGVECDVVEWMKRSTLRWFDHIERMENEEFVKKVYLSSVKGTNRRGRPVGRWEDRVYVSERGVRGNGLEWEGRECMDWERWRSICSGHPLSLCGSMDKRLIDLMCGHEELFEMTNKNSDNMYKKKIHGAPMTQWLASLRGMLAMAARCWSA